MDRDSAVGFIKKNAIGIDLATYEYLFEKKNNLRVVEELRKYQNEDGGFGNRLEADNWNPLSNPIAVNDALIRLMKVDAVDLCPDITDGMVKYLEAHDSFDEEKRRWLFAIESNRDYPHAKWWEKEGDGISGFNPTMSLCAFILCFVGRDKFYEDIFLEGIEFLACNEEIGSDSLKCFMTAYLLLEKYGITDITDMSDFRNMIIDRIEKSICKDTSKYGIDYVPSPSDFIALDPEVFMSAEIRKLALVEKEILGKLQKDDGGFDIFWNWNTPYETEFQKARSIWRSKITIEKLLFNDFMDCNGN